MLSSRSLLKRLAELDEQTAAILATALASGDSRLALMAIRESREMVATYAKVSPVARDETRRWAWENERAAQERALSAPPSHWLMQAQRQPPQPRTGPPAQKNPFQSDDPDADRFFGGVSDENFNRLFDAPPTAKHPRDDAAETETEGGGDDGDDGDGTGPETAQ